MYGQGEIADGVSGKQGIPERKQQMFADRDHYRGDDIRILRDYYDAAVDWERRDDEEIISGHYAFRCDGVPLRMRKQC